MIGHWIFFWTHDLCLYLPPLPRVPVNLYIRFVLFCHPCLFYLYICICNPVCIIYVYVYAVVYPCLLPLPRVPMSATSPSCTCISVSSTPPSTQNLCFAVYIEYTAMGWTRSSVCLVYIISVSATPPSYTHVCYPSLVYLYIRYVWMVCVDQLVFSYTGSSEPILVKFTLDKLK